MAETIGRLADCGWGVESTRGTITTIDYWVPSLTKDHQDRAEFVKNESAYGVLHKDSGMTKTLEYGEGSISGKVFLDSIGALFTALAGQSPTSNTVSGETTHTWTQANNVTNKSLTVAMVDDNEDLQFARAMVDTLTLNWELDQYFNYDVSFKSELGTSSSSTPAYTAETEFSPTHSAIKVAANLAGLGAAPTIEVISANITFAKNVEGRRILGSASYADIHNRTVEVTGNLEVTYTNTTYRGYVFNETEQAMRLSVVNTDVTLANSSNPYIYIDLDKVRFMNREKTIDNDDIMTETVEFTALIDLSNSSQAYQLQVLNEHGGSNY